MALASKSLLYSALKWQKQPCLSFPWCAPYSSMTFVSYWCKHYHKLPPRDQKQLTNCSQIQYTSAGHMLSVSLVRLSAKSTVSYPAWSSAQRWTPMQGRLYALTKGNQICRTESPSSFLMTQTSLSLSPPPFQFPSLASSFLTLSLSVALTFCSGSTIVGLHFKEAALQLRKRDLDGMSV